MHRSLQIPDLVQLLCVEIAGDDLARTGYGPEASRDLAALAWTCKTFQDPALDKLWEHQNNTMINVLMCMPDGIWHRPEADGKKGLELTRPIKTEDWERPLTYMHRVKTFIPRENSMPSSRLLETLSLCFPGDHFFPNLRYLCWPTATAFANLPLIRIFLSPTITRIYIDIAPSIHHLSLLPTLAVKCPDLKEARIACPGAGDLTLTAVRSTSLFIVGLGTLESLNVYDIDRAAFTHLAQLRTLRSLEIGKPEGFSPASDLTEGIFVGLQKLTFRSINPDSLANFLRPFRKSPLHSLNISIAPSDLAKPSIYLAIADNLCQQGTLRDLTVRSTATVVPRGSVPLVIRDDMIPPLFRFTELTALCLYSRDGFDFDDAMLSQMAESWPRIEVLDLMVVSESHTLEPRATLNSLLMFAHRCSCLKTLTVFIDASVVPTLDNPDVSVTQDALTTLCVGGSSISAPIADVASFLFAVFPNLSDLDTGYWEWEHELDLEDDELDDDRVIHHRRWKKAERLLPAHVPSEEEEENGSVEEEGVVDAD
ncbi:hypothetical protein DFH09DRAFT_1027499 [Mycena vulgaris]|nr:hypothetical protein DFH09DRAFT_1027499 [Mycena vulgaris]